MRRLALAALALMVAAAPRLAEDAAAGPALTRAPESRLAPSPTRPNAEMARDILDLAFELESGRAIPTLSRFEGPVTVGVSGPAPATLSPDLDALLARLRAEAGLDIARTSGPARITVEAVPAADLAREAPGAACFVVPGASSWARFLARQGTPALDWTQVTRRVEAAVFLPAEAAPQEVRDCLHEELAQALGPLDDLARLRDSVFNDDDMQSTLTGFDMLALRALNDPGLASGMTRAEVAARLPAILARLNPGGERRLDPGSPHQAKRRQEAGAAATLARADDGADASEGAALYALGLRSNGDPEAALAAFRAARAAFAHSPLTDIHRAHVEVQLAAFALASGDYAEVRRLAADAAPIAEAHGDASLLATLLMLRAEALAAMGDAEGADAARLDALAWARYGFGDAAAVDARLAEVEALSPWRLANARRQGGSR